MSALAVQLPDPNVIPQSTPPILAMNVIYYGTLDEATHVMPWTEMTPSTAPLFATRLVNLIRPSQGNNLMDEGVELSTASLLASGYPSGTFSSMLVIADGSNWPSDDPSGALALEAARDAALSPLNPGGFDRICAYAVREDWQYEVITRQYCLDHLVGSRIVVPGNPPGEDNIGFAGEPDLFAQHPLEWHDPNFDDLLKLMLRRVTLCPSDYDRNGIQTQNVDLTQFIVGVQQMAPYADWNFDTVFDGLNPTGLDRLKIEAPFPVGCP